jgi:hypothetical protein
MTLHPAFGPEPLERTENGISFTREVLEIDRWLTDGLAPARDVLVATTDRLAISTSTKVGRPEHTRGWSRFFAPTRRRLVGAAIAVAFAVSSLTPVGHVVAAAAGEAVQSVERALFPAPGRPGDQIEPANDPAIDWEPAP